MEMKTPWADYPLLLYRPPGITFDALGHNKKPPELLRFGGFFLFFSSHIAYSVFLYGKRLRVYTLHNSKKAVTAD